jgi:hypothetical protein
MHLKKLLILILLLDYCLEINSQVFYNADDMRKFESRLQIQNFLGSLLSYPFESLEKMEMGVLIGEIILTDSSSNDIVHICSGISKVLDSEFLKAMNITLINYRPVLQSIASNDSITFYAIYSIEGNDFEISYNNIPKRFIGPLKLKASNHITSTNPNLTKDIQANPDSYYMKEVAELISKNKIVESEMESNSNAKRKMDNLLINNRYKRAIDYLNELIRRNPFNPEFFIQRAELFEKIGQIQQAQEDYYFIISYIDDYNYKKLAKERVNKYYAA